MNYKKRLEQRREAERKKRLSERKQSGDRLTSAINAILTFENNPKARAEKELSDAVRALIKSKTPPGARAVVGYDMADYQTPWPLRFVCNGAVQVSAYECCLEPGHAGQCLCSYKSVYFTPESDATVRPHEESEL